MAMVISFLGLLMLFANQLRVLFKGVGVKRARSAALGPRSSDGLANTLNPCYCLLTFAYMLVNSVA